VPFLIYQPELARFKTIWLGDFNAWSPLWGSPGSNGRGKALERAIVDSNMITLNDGSATHISTHNTLTRVDVSFISPRLAHISEWSVFKSPHGSDHFLIQIVLCLNPSPDSSPPLPKYKTDLANWKLFESECANFPLYQTINHRWLRLKVVAAPNVVLQNTLYMAASRFWICLDCRGDHL